MVLFLTYSLVSGIPKIEFKPKALLDDTLVFRHYNAQEAVLGKTMEEWLRFSVVFWHTFRGVGEGQTQPNVEDKNLYSRKYGLMPKG